MVTNYAVMHVLDMALCNHASIKQSIFLLISCGIEHSMNAYVDDNTYIRSYKQINSQIAHTI